MCEIAVFDPERASIEIIQQVAYKFHEEQGDGIGFVIVKNEGDHFEYNTYKSIEPHWQTVYTFLKRTIDDAWRVVVHGRNGTSGSVSREAAHPIAIDCDECEFDYVVHNGSVRDYKNKQTNIVENGHRLNTGVDTEVIAHEVSVLPDTIENHSYRTYDMYGRLNYLLFSENGILVRNGQKYDTTDDFVMTCSRNDFDNAEDMGFEYAKNHWLLVKPDGDEPDIESKERGYSHSGTQSSRRRGGVAGRTGGVSSSRASSGDEDRTHVAEYIDLASWDTVSAYQVTPDCIKVLNRAEDEVEYVYRHRRPRLYYWYSDEDAPDNLEELEERGEAIRELINGGEAEYEDDGFQGALADEVAEGIQRTVGDVADIDSEVETRAAD